MGRAGGERGAESGALEEGSCPLGPAPALSPGPLIGPPPAGIRPGPPTMSADLVAPGTCSEVTTSRATCWPQEDGRGPRCPRDGEGGPRALVASPGVQRRRLACLFSVIPSTQPTPVLPVGLSLAPPTTHPPVHPQFCLPVRLSPACLSVPPSILVFPEPLCPCPSRVGLSWPRGPGGSHRGLLRPQRRLGGHAGGGDGDAAGKTGSGA